jgi:hypothetical protein
MGHKAALSMGLAVAATFAILAGINLEKQGLYYDEVHQAPASFTYLGRHTPSFNVEVGGVPILNMSYSGALKSHAYGLYLKFLNPHFTVYSWRLLGILFVAAGLMAFYALTAGALPFAAAALFGALLLTDTSILLTTRHDWGPTALALCLRLVFLGLWFSSQLGRPDRWKHAAAGCIVGLAIFEKLSSVVLLAPLALFLLADRRLPRAWLAMGLGFAAGCLPLVVANTVLGLGLISFSGIDAGGAAVDLRRVLRFSYEYLSLGQGEMTRHFVLGESRSPFWIRSEAVLSIALALVVGVAALRRRSLGQPIVLAGLLIAAYGIVGISLLMLPRNTSAHHWVLGTPFQYGAMGLAFAAFVSRTNRRDREWVVLKGVFLTALTMLIALRVASVAGLERSLAAGRAGERYDPAFTRLAEIAASRSGDAVFIAADWGTAMQILCMSDAAEDLVHEPFWAADPAGQVTRIAEATPKDSLYVVVTGIAPQFRAASASILQSLARNPNWREAPTEGDLPDLAPIQVRKFVRIVSEREVDPGERVNAR